MVTTEDEKEKGERNKMIEEKREKCNCGFGITMTMGEGRKDDRREGICG